MHDGPLPDAAYATSLPADIVAGATGVPVIDQAVRALYANGYLQPCPHVAGELRRASAQSALACWRRLDVCAPARWRSSPAITSRGSGLLAPPAASPICSTPTTSRATLRRNGTARTVIDTDYASLEAQARLPALAPVRVGAHLSIAPSPHRSAPPDDAGFASS